VPSLPDRVIQTIERHRMFTGGQQAGVAVSGGADSVCLLHLLVELASRWTLRLTVLHLDHGLRGEESCQDAEFVAGMAAALGLPCEIHRASLAAREGNLEQAARDARLEFFREAMAARGLERLALGHTRSDQAETVLFRFLRGAGTAGLAAIRPVTSEGFVRPLRDLGREEVRQFLRDRGIAWREDSTNASLGFARNRIRARLMPQLREEWNPAIEETLVHTADWALAEESWWEAEIGRLAAGCLVEREDGILLRAAALRDLPLAAARRMVRHAIERAKGSLLGVDFSHTAAVLELASRPRGSGSFRAAGFAVCRSLDWLRFVNPARQAPCPRPYRLAATGPGILPLPGTGISISLELFENAETSAPPAGGYNKETVGLDGGCLVGPLELRNWQPGDVYQPAGSSRPKKLKALFHEARIPVWDRSGWPVLTDGGAIVWTRRFGPAAGVAARSGARVILSVREIRNRDESRARL